ncbi:hypothetical protein ACNKHL_00755 [Shigella flexneri]
MAKGEAKSPLLTPEKAIELLGTMQGGYDISSADRRAGSCSTGTIAAKALAHTLLMFDNYYDVEEKAKAGNEYAKQVMRVTSSCRMRSESPRRWLKTNPYRLQSHWRN